MAKKTKLKKCKTCVYWVLDKKWTKPDGKKWGICCFDPPQLLQILIPTVVRESGLTNIKEKKARFQMRPSTTSNEFCSHHRG